MAVLSSNNDGSIDIGLPASWEDHCVIRSDGTDGGVIQGSLTHINDNGHMSIGKITAPVSTLEIWDDDAHPVLSITAAHATDYDPMIHFRTDVVDTVKCSIGVDSGDSDKFKIYMGDGIGGTSQFVIDSSGNMGIGTDTPTGKLEVVKDSYPVIRGRRLTNLTSAKGAGFDLTIETSKDMVENFGSGITLSVQDNGLSNPEILAGIYVGRGDTDTSGNLVFSTRNGGTFDADNNGAMWITYNKRVGIGTNSPTVEFQVIGDAFIGTASDSIYIKDDGDEIALVGYNGSAYNDVEIRAKASTQLRLDTSGNIGINESAPETLLELTSTAPYLTLHNSEEEDIEGGRESIIWFSGEQSGGEETHLAAIRAQHDGALDDQKGDLIFYTNDGSDGDAPTERMRIDSSGYVGINTTDPITQFQVIGTTTSTKINLGGGLTEFILNAVPLDAVVGATSQIATELQYIGIQHSNIALAGARFMYARSRGTLATPLIVQNGDSLAALDAAAFDGTDYVLAGEIDFEVDGVPGANDMPGRILFKTTADGGVLPTERMRIDSSGYVGINEPAPQDTLEVNGTVLVKDALKFTQDDGNEYIDSLADGYMDYGATTAHRFNNDIFPATDDSYYLGKNSAATPFAWKGVILKDTTDGNYYRIEIINGVITATVL